MVDTLLRLERLVSDHAARNPRESHGRGASSDECRMVRDWRPEIESLLADGWRLKAIADVLPSLSGVPIDYAGVARYLRVVRDEADIMRPPDPDRLALLEQAAEGSGKSPKSAAGVIRRYAAAIRALLARGHDPEAIAAALAEETGLRIDRYRMVRIAEGVSQGGARRPSASAAGAPSPVGNKAPSVSGTQAPAPAAGAAEPQERRQSMSAELFTAVGPPPAVAKGALDAEMEEIKRRLDEKLASDPARQPSEQTKAMLAEIERMTGVSRS